MVYASQLFASEDHERAFRDKIERLLRDGEAEAALAEIDLCLREISVTPFTALALGVDRTAVALTGWDGLARRIAALDAHGQPISAIAIDFAPDGDNGTALECSYYCDEVFPFSKSDRTKLDAACGRSGPRWRGSHEHSDRDLRITGFGQLSAAYPAALPHIERGELPEPADYDAPRLCAMRASVLLHLAVARAVAEHGLPRPLTVLCGGDEHYPYIIATVTTGAEYEEATDATAEAGDTDEALFTSLASLAPVRMTSDYRATAETEHVSGRSLRRRIAESHANDADESEPVEAKASGLFSRLFRRAG